MFVIHGLVFVMAHLNRQLSLFARGVKEAVYIQAHKPGLNSDRADTTFYISGFGLVLLLFNNCKTIFQSYSKSGTTS